MRWIGAWAWIGILSAGLVLGSAASAVVQGQQDDFTMSANGWGHGAPALGGPGGGSDGFLLLTSDGSGPLGRLVTYNQSQWAGDYLGPGVEAIGMFLNNLGATDLEMRVAIGNSPAPSVGGAWYASSQSVSLPAGSGWTFAVFPIGSADLQVVQSGASYTSVLSNAVTLRILHSSLPSAMGDNIVATLGIDRVIALPEPGAPAMLGCGLAALALCAGLRARRERV